MELIWHLQIITTFALILWYLKPVYKQWKNKTFILPKFQHYRFNKVKLHELWLASKTSISQINKSNIRIKRLKIVSSLFIISFIFTIWFGPNKYVDGIFVSHNQAEQLKDVNKQARQVQSFFEDPTNKSKEKIAEKAYDKLRDRVSIIDNSVNDKPSFDDDNYNSLAWVDVDLGALFSGGKHTKEDIKQGRSSLLIFAGLAADEIIENSIKENIVFEHQKEISAKVVHGIKLT